MENMYQNNRIEFIKKIKNGSVALFESGCAPHKTTDQYYHYTTNRNFYFLTGLNEENLKLMIVKGETQTYTFLFIEKTTDYMKQWVGEAISKEEASLVTGIPVTKVYYHDQFDQIFRSLMTYARGLGIKPPRHLYLDLYRVKPTIPPIALDQFKEVLSIYPEMRVLNANEYLSFQRMFKSNDEVADLKKAIDMTNNGLNRIMNALKTRDNEQQIEADFLHEISLQGSRGNSFNTIAASGVNATVLHYENNNGPLHKGELLLCDLGALHNNYASDISRTYPISGTYTARQKELYEIVLKANKESIQYLRPGLTWKELNKFAKDILISECKRIGLIEEDAEISKYYYHSIGHFLGLDVHDVGQYDKVLAEGMVITIEPGLYIKEEGIGIRIEDDILITKDGSINLSKDIIKEIVDIEAYMK